MDFQTLAVILIATFAMIFLGRMFYQAFFSDKICDGACGCSADELRKLAKKSTRSEVL